MDTQQMLNKIYEKYADKTLSFGCRLEVDLGEIIIYNPASSLYNFRYIEEAIEIGKEIPHCCVIGDKFKHDAIIFKKIIGHPITLARVLSALEDAYGYNDEYGCIFGIDKRYERYTICDRKLLNENGSDAILDDQSDETIKVIYNILFPTT